MASEAQHGAAARLLARIVDASAPHSLVCCGEVARSVATHWCEQRADTRLIRLDQGFAVADLAAVAAFDLALVSNVLERWPRGEGEQLLGLLRNYGIQRIAVLVADDSGWSFKDFIGLGFRRHAELEGPKSGSTLYTYNLDSYNHRRDWNNPRHWANPEMWGKAWW